MGIFKQLTALALVGVAGILAGCGSDERAQIAAAILPEARAAAPAGIPAAEIRSKRHRGPPHAAASASAASAASAAASAS